MTSSHPSLLPTKRRDRRGGMTGGLIACLILVGVFGVIGYRFFVDNDSRANLDGLIVATASRGAFDHIVLEQGEIASSSNQVVICEVESRGMGGTSILWVIDEGSKVKKGDKLVELDSSQLELSLKEKKIRVITAESNVTTAQANVQQAKIAREEYLQGVYNTDAKALESEKALAEQELRKATLARDSSKRLAAKGLVKSLQLEADRFAVANAQNKLDAAKQKLWVLENLTKQKMLVGFDSDIEAAEANLSAAQSELIEEEQELAELEDQIRKCVLYAPADGVVVHANRFSSRGGNAEFVVEPGATVRERQEIIKLPDPTMMHVDCKINESRITLIDEGIPSLITVDAIPGLQLKGRVKKVNRYAEPGSWYSSSTKEYTTLVEIIDPPENIRTGMTAEVQIFVEQLEDALQVPIQALYEHGEAMYCLVRRPGNKFETVLVEMAATNSTMAAINSGLEQGDVVVLNLREHLTLMDLPELEREDNSGLRSLKQDSDSPGADGPSDDRGGPGEGRGGPGGGGAGEGRGGPGEGRGGAGGGGPGGGEGAGGGGFNPAMIANRIMESMDKDGDGKLSSEEMAGGDERRAAMLGSADKDGDGSVSKAEIIQAMSSRSGGGGAPGGGGGGAPGGGGGGRPGGGGGGGGGQ